MPRLLFIALFVLSGCGARQSGLPPAGSTPIFAGGGPGVARGAAPPAIPPLVPALVPPVAQPSTPAGAGGAALSPIRLVEALPATLGRMRRNGTAVNYEANPATLGMGASAGYRQDDEPGHATVYIYDRGQARGPEGGDSTAVMQELQRAAAEIGQARQMGLYRQASYAGLSHFQHEAVPGGVRCVNFRLVQRDGTPTTDNVCVVVRQGRFLKMRLTLPALPDIRPSTIVAGVMMLELWSGRPVLPTAPGMPQPAGRLRSARVEGQAGAEGVWARNMDLAPRIG